MNARQTGTKIFQGMAAVQQLARLPVTPVARESRMKARLPEPRWPVSARVCNPKGRAEQELTFPTERCGA